MNKRTISALATLYDGFFSLLKEKTFDKITVRELCSWSKVNKMTFYKYHEDKYDCLSKAFKYALDSAFEKRFGPDMIGYQGSDRYKIIYESIRVVFDWVADHRTEVHNIYVSNDHFAYEVAKQCLFENYCDAAKKGSHLRGKDCDESYLVSFYFNGAFACLEMYARALRSSEPKESVEAKKESFCRYLAKVLASHVTPDPEL